MEQYDGLLPAVAVVADLGQGWPELVTPEKTRGRSCSPYSLIYLYFILLGTLSIHVPRAGFGIGGK